MPTWLMNSVATLGFFAQHTLPSEEYLLVHCHPPNVRKPVPTPVGFLDTQKGVLSRLYFSDGCKNHSTSIGVISSVHIVSSPVMNFW